MLLLMMLLLLLLLLLMTASPLRFDGAKSRCVYLLYAHLDAGEHMSRLAFKLVSGKQSSRQLQAHCLRRASAHSHLTSADDRASMHRGFGFYYL